MGTAPSAASSPYATASCAQRATWGTPRSTSRPNPTARSTWVRVWAVASSMWCAPSSSPARSTRASTTPSPSFSLVRWLRMSTSGLRIQSRSRAPSPRESSSAARASRVRTMVRASRPPRDGTCTSYPSRTRAPWSSSRRTSLPSLTSARPRWCSRAGSRGTCSTRSSTAWTPNFSTPACPSLQTAARTSAHGAPSPSCQRTRCGKFWTTMRR
mmetsp:Transcript_21833/g.58844  ORF Transcript_21833/g.58844 Transcript_21833/m.58844 type:complete len:213 (+) Transcript_21833:366-1004(+)